MLKFPFSRFVVEEDSMFPAYKPGDHVLTFNLTEPKAGDVIVFKIKENFFIKRIYKINKTLFYVSGDNKKESAKLAPVSKEQIVGKVIFKY